MFMCKHCKMIYKCRKNTDNTTNILNYYNMDQKQIDKWINCNVCAFPNSILTPINSKIAKLLWMK